MLRAGKARWSFLHNYLVGMPWGRWRVLRAENQVDPGYRHRAAYLTGLSLRNSVYRRLEERRFGAAVAATRIEGPPLFVLGHWRTGTTLLHSLLACDSEQFAAPNSIQASYPFTFLTTEAAVRRQFAALVPHTRPMDGVAMSPDTPQEEEFALCVASLKSPCLGMFSFPRRAEHYDRYLTFRDVPEAEVEEWKAVLVWFLKKLTLKHCLPLLLKSPPHTARLRLLLELFPDARFVHIHRDPYAVFQSTLHLHRRLLAINGLQAAHGEGEAHGSRLTAQGSPGTTVLEEQILRRYVQMHEVFFEERGLIPAGQFHEVRFDELEADPVGQVRAVYERLGLEGFEAVRPRLEQYVASLTGYRKNQFAELSPEQERRVARAWRRSFEAWEYRV